MFRAKACLYKYCEGVMLVYENGSVCSMYVVLSQMIVCVVRLLDPHSVSLNLWVQ